MKNTKSSKSTVRTPKTPAMLKKLIGKPVIVRAGVAGVHCGIAVGIDPASSTILLKDACRLWRYYTRDITGSVSDVAANGLCENKDHNIGAKLESVLIVNPPGLEVVEATDAAYASVLKFAAT